MFMNAQLQLFSAAWVRFSGPCPLCFQQWICSPFTNETPEQKNAELRSAAPLSMAAARVSILNVEPGS